MKWPFMSRKRHEDELKWKMNTIRNYEQLLREERKKVEDFLSEFTSTEVTKSYPGDGIRINVGYTVTEQFLYQCHNLDSQVWDYIAERLGGEIANHLKGMSFAAIQDSRRLTNRPVW